MAQYENDEEAITKLESLKGLDKPVFAGQTVSGIEREPRNEKKIIHTTETGESYIQFSLGEENGLLHMHFNFKGDYLSQIEEFLSSLLPIVSNAYLNYVQMDLESESQFDNLDLPIESDFEYGIEGMRVSKTDEENFIFQKTDEGTQVRADYTPEDGEDGITEDIISEKLDRFRDFLSEF